MNKVYQTKISCGMLLLFLTVLLMGIYENEKIVKAESQSAFVIDDGYLTSYIGNAKEIVIPDEVKVIGIRAFEMCESIESVVIDGKVEKIENEAFCGCVNLKKVVITAPVKEVESCVFIGCEKLEQLTLPNTVTVFGKENYVIDPYSKLYKNMEEEGKMVINGSVLLYAGNEKKKVVLPKGVKVIPAYAFWENKTIEEIVCNNDLKTISVMAFGHCVNLKKVILPKGKVNISGGAFLGTEWLMSMQKESPCVVVGNVLLDAEKTSGKIVIPSKVEIINEQAFWGNEHVISIIIPNTVKKIEPWAICDCKKIKKLQFPTSIERIEMYTVCESEIETLIIPKEVKYIEKWAFYECSIKKVKMSRETFVEEDAFPKGTKIIYK